MPWWLPAAIQGGSTILSYAARKKTPKFEHTSYGRELGRMSREGKYSPAARANIAGQAGAKAGQVAQEQKADIRGYLEARGMGNSIAGAKALSSPDTARMRTVSETAGLVEEENELSKSNARLEYARARGQYDEARRAEENQAASQLIGGFGGALSSAYSSYSGEQQNSEINSQLEEVKSLGSAGNIDEAKRLLLMLMARYGNAQ